MKAYHDAWVNLRYFHIKDQVLFRGGASKPLEVENFAKNYEGPYVMLAIVQPGIYKLQTLTGDNIPRVWNSEHFMCFIS